MAENVLTGPESSVPEQLHKRLVDLRPILEVQGTLQLREGNDRVTSWRIRYRNDGEELGYRKHRSLSLGRDESIARAAWDLVAKWRTERAREAEHADARLQLARLEAQKTRVLRQIVQASLPGSRDVRRRAGRDFDKAVTAGPREALLFSIHIPYEYSARPRGRPKKAKLW